MRSSQVLISILLLITFQFAFAEGIDNFNTLIGYAEKGDANAQNKIAVSYMQGTGVSKDLSKAFFWFEKAANQNHVEAQYHYATFILNGYATAKSPEKSITWFEKSAQRGNINAQNSLGILYMIGLGTKINYAESFKWLQKAAEGGIADAMYNLGQLYEKGAGTDQNSFKAIYWYEQAAKQGFTGAEFELGVAHANGLGGYEKNITKATEWYEKAANKGNVFAQANLGHIYSRGCSNVDYMVVRNDKGIKSIVPNDYRQTCHANQAFYWYRRAAEGGLPDVQFIIGSIYAGMGDISKLEGLEWINKSALNKYPPANEYIAKHQKELEKTTQALKEKFKRDSESWPYKPNLAMSQAAEDLNPILIERRAIAYQFGLLGFEQNLITATEGYIKYLTIENIPRFSHSQKNLEAVFSRGLQQTALNLKDEYVNAKASVVELANNGDLTAIKFIARFYVSGSCEFFSMKEARAWYEKAANLNDKNAMLALARLYKSSAPNQSGPEARSDYTKSLYWFKKLDLSDKPNAQYDLAGVYLNEKFPTYDPEAAIETLEKASDNNHLEAKKTLAKIYQDGKLVAKNPDRVAVLMKDVSRLEKTPSSNNAGSSLKPPKSEYCGDPSDEFDTSPVERLILIGKDR